MIPIIAGAAGVVMRWFAGNWLKLGVVVVVGLGIAAVWLHMHSMSVELTKLQADYKEQGELHEAREALLKMSVQGHEAARLAGERNEEILRKITEQERVDEVALRKVILKQSRRLDELFQQHSEAKAWGATLHPKLVTECMQSIISGANAREGDSPITTQGSCDLSRDSMDSTANTP